MPLSCLPDPDSELPPPIPLPEDPHGRRSSDKDGWPGLAYLVLTAFLLTAAGYGTSFLAEYLPSAVTPLLTLGPLPVLGLVVWLVRRGVANPHIRMYKRWRSRAQDWREQALDAQVEIDHLNGRVAAMEDLVDEVAHLVTGVDDPDIARRRLNERLERQRAGKRRGRPPRTPNDVSYEEALEIARQIRQRHANGMSWSNAVKPFGISIDTARNRIRWLEDEEARQEESA